MPLSGYLDGFVPAPDPSILFDATDLLAEACFWPAFLHSLGGSTTAVEAFDADPAAVGEMLTSLHGEDTWPVIPIRLNDGHSLHILFRNFPGEGGWDYLLTGPGLAQPLTGAALDGHFMGPGLCWSELTTIAARSHGGSLRPAERLLLLLPAVGDVAVPSDAAPVVAAALRAVGARRHRDDVAGELPAAQWRFWGATAWRDLGGVLCCLSEHSPRSSIRPSRELRAFSRAFGSN